MKTLERARAHSLSRFRSAPGDSRLRLSQDGRALLNLGCGGVFTAEWNNFDAAPSSSLVEPWDAVCGIPFPGSTFDVVYHSHFLEHLTLDLATFITLECFRVLKPGGTIRILVPDLEYSARLYLEAASRLNQENDGATLEHYEWSVINLVDQMTRVAPGGEMLPFLSSPTLTDLEYVVRTGGGPEVRSIRSPNTTARSFFDRALRAVLEPRRVVRRLKAALHPRSAEATGELHRWAYDVYSLSSLLTMCGFSEVVRRTETESGIEDWRRLSLDVTAAGETRKPHSLVLEARRGYPETPSGSTTAGGYPHPSPSPGSQQDAE